MRVCRERDVAVQAIKSIARGQWSGKGKARETWYEPLEDHGSIERAVHYVLSKEGGF